MSQVIQRLGLSASPSGDTSSIPGQETKIPQAVWVQPKAKQNKKPQIINSLLPYGVRTPYSLYPTFRPEY